jgi:hypothetical protein
MLLRKNIRDIPRTGTDDGTVDIMDRMITWEEIRMDRVALVKERIRNGYYDNKDLYRKVSKILVEVLRQNPKPFD